MTSAFSTITNSVNLLLVDTSVITSNKPYVAYVSSTSIPGRIATIRDSTGYLSSPNQQIIISSTKDVLFNSNVSSISITQPYGFVSLISRDKNTWNVINNYAFPGPTVAYVSSVYATDGIFAQSYFASLYVSTPYVNTSNISSFNLVASNSISTNSLFTNRISTNSLQVNNSFIAPTAQITSLSTVSANIVFLSSGSILVNSLSSFNIQANSILTNSITTNSISTPNVLTNSISTTNLRASTISTNMLFAPNISSINFQASNIFTNNIITNNIITSGISTNNFLTNSISTNNLFASNISTNFLLANVVSTNNVLTNSISTANILVNSISTNNLQANTISTNILNTTNISSIRSWFNNISSVSINSGSIRNANMIITSNITASNLSLNDGCNGTFFTVSSFFDLNLNFHRLLKYTNVNDSNYVASDWSYFPAKNGLELSNNNILNVNNITSSNISVLNNLYINNTISALAPATSIFIANLTNFLSNDVIGINNLGISLINGFTLDYYNNIYWSGFLAVSNVNMNSNQINNVQQTNNYTDVATNVIIPRVLSFENNAINTFDTGSFFQVYDTGNQPSFIMYFNNISVTFPKILFNFQLKANLNYEVSTLYLYFTCSNTLTTQEYEGNTFNSNYPFVVNSYNINNTISLSYQDIFNFTSGGTCNDENYKLNLYVSQNTPTIFSNSFTYDRTTFTYQFVNG